MPSTRSGKTKYKVGPEHQGRYAVANGTFASRKNKRKAEDQSRASTDLRTTQVEDRHKTIRISEPSPPTPTKEELIKLPRATRHSKPCCLHYSIDKGAREILYPDYFFCGNCDAYVEAMIHSSRKALIKKDSANFICQADHTSYIFPTTKKSDRIHHMLLLQLFKEVEEEDSNNIEVLLPPLVAAVATRYATVTSTPPPGGKTLTSDLSCHIEMPLPRSQSSIQQDTTSSTPQLSVRY